jgi:hypothetical protein
MSGTASTKVITPKGMISYPHLDKPQDPQAGSNQKPKYSATLVFAPGTDLSQLVAAAIAAADEKWPGKGAEMLKGGKIRSPFRKDAVDKGYTAERGFGEGSVFINCRTEQKPGVVLATAGGDGKPQVVKDEDIRSTIYPGCFGRFSVRAFGYDNNGNRGVSFALNNVQKLGDGERLDGRISAENEFDADMSAAPADLSGII